MRLILCLLTLLACSSASATLWNVQSVLQGTDGGFGFSSLHDADDNTPMSGDIITTIDSASGTFDDVSGLLDVELTLGTGDILSLDGVLGFAGNGFLAGNTTLAYSGLNGLATTGGTPIPDSGQLGFLPGDNICCNSSSFGPNSFLDGGGGAFFLTLWGADFVNPLGNIFAGDYDGSTFGMDVRLEMSPVPLPATAWLFGSALLGLAGLRRRDKTAA